MQKLEGQYYLFKYGLLEPGVWEKRSMVARSIIDPPLMRAWWDNELLIATFSDEFVQAVEDADSLSVPASKIFRKPSTTAD